MIHMKEQNCIEAEKLKPVFDLIDEKVTFHAEREKVKRNLFVNEVENWFQFFSLYTILLFHMYQSAISYTIKPIFIIKCHISIP